MAAKVHTVSSFLTPKSTDRELRVAERRDIGAQLDIIVALMRQGYEFGEHILDFPPPRGVAKPWMGPRHKVARSFLKPGDLLVHTTRPPIDDAIERPKKTVRRSYTDLEDDFFAVWEEYLSSCDRSKVELHERLYNNLSQEHASRRKMGFRQSEAGPYLQLNDCEGSGWVRTDEETERRTAVFLLRVEEAWQGGPGLVSAWGMDGTATAVWAYRLNRDFCHLLAKPGFVLAELTNAGVPERPTNMLWAKDWKVEILLHEK